MHPFSENPPPLPPDGYLTERNDCDDLFPPRTILFSTAWRVEAGFILRRQGAGAASFPLCRLDGATKAAAFSSEVLKGDWFFLPSLRSIPEYEGTPLPAILAVSFSPPPLLAPQRHRLQGDQITPPLPFPLFDCRGSFFLMHAVRIASHCAMSSQAPYDADSLCAAKRTRSFPPGRL